MKILFSGPIRFTGDNWSALRALGCDIVRLPGSEREHWDMDFSDIEGVVCAGLFEKNHISRFTSLRYVQTLTHGVDHLPLDYIGSHGITLRSASGLYSVPIAEFVLGAVLQLYRDFPRFAAMQREHRWEKVFNARELGGKRVCVLGTGSIGREIALRFSAMGCAVTGLCRRPAPVPGFDRVLPMSALDDTLADSDIVILALPLNGGSRGLFDNARFEKLKPGALFVNIARGGIVDTPALIHALDSGRLGGAVLDVFDPEPLPGDSPLWDMPHVLVTPHSSFAGEFSARRMFEIVYNNLSEYLK